ncbi:hypothetical protein DDSR119_44 [Pseudomonas phage DDSR119]|nr:hypothetical protein DDSR119_44 [Pseudomonas phage DDSR119]
MRGNIKVIGMAGMSENQKAALEQLKTNMDKAFEEQAVLDELLALPQPKIGANSHSAAEISEKIQTGNQACGGEVAGKEFVIHQLNSNDSGDRPRRYIGRDVTLSWPADAPLPRHLSVQHEGVQVEDGRVVDMGRQVSMSYSMDGETWQEIGALQAKEFAVSWDEARPGDDVTAVQYRELPKTSPVLVVGGGRHGQVAALIAHMRHILLCARVTEMATRRGYQHIFSDVPRVDRAFEIETAKNVLPKGFRGVYSSTRSRAGRAARWR